MLLPDILRCPHTIPQRSMADNYAVWAGWPGAPSFSRTLRKGWDSTAVSRMGFSEPHDPPFSSHFSCTAITDTKSQSRINSPTVQHRKLRPSPETDPKSAAKPFSAAL